MSTSRPSGAPPAVPIPGSYLALMSEALVLSKRGQHQEALAITERVRSRITRLPERRRGPGSELHEALVGATALHANSAYQLGDVETAEALWRDLELLDVENPNRWRREPIIRRIKRGETVPWLRELDKLVRESPGDVEGWLALAVAAAEAKDTETLEAALQQAEGLLEPDDGEDALAAFHLMRHYLYREQGRWAEALEEWDEFLDYEDDLYGWNEGFLHMLLEAEEFDLALELLDDESIIEPEKWYYQAGIASRRGDSVRARHLWRQLVDAETDEEIGLVGIKATALCWLGRTKEALALALEEASLIHAMPPSLATALALAWGMEGNVDSARANLTLATRQADKVVPMSRVVWYDFDTLISDDQIKASLREFFDLD
ncbi:MAG: tetratricopeptide repeat protein [Caldilineales bacterium]